VIVKLQRTQQRQGNVRLDTGEVLNRCLCFADLH